MNRHERRKAASVARGEADPTDSYVRCCAMMVSVLREWRRQNPTVHPHFALLHRETPLCASIDDVPLIFRNDAARELRALFCAGADLIERGNAPTVMMLQALLDEEGVEYEQVAPGELGVDTAARIFNPTRKVPSS